MLMIGYTFSHASAFGWILCSSWSTMENAGLKIMDRTGRSGPAAFRPFSRFKNRATWSVIFHSCSFPSHLFI